MKEEDIEIDEQTIKDAELLVMLANSTLQPIYENARKLVKDKRDKLASNYIRALVIDLLGSLVTESEGDRNPDMEYICKWIKFRHGVEMEIKIKHLKQN